MTPANAYKIHVNQAAMVAKKLAVQSFDLAKHGFAVNTIENRKYDENAKNPNSTARGMMQMLVGTQKELETKYLKTDHNPSRIFEPNYAIYLGLYELARQYIRYGGDWRKAVHAYNRGSYQPKKSNTKSFASGENYANSVMNALYKTDYAALNTQNGYDVTAANNRTSSLSHKEWS